MSKEVLCIILLVVFFAIMIYVGFYSRKHATDVNGFVLGGRGVGPWLTAFAFGTSYFSAVIFVGYAGQFGWNFGLASTWAGLGNAFIGSLLAWNVLGRRTRIMTQHVDAKTMPDFFGKRFDSEPLKVTASVIVFRESLCWAALLQSSWQYYAVWNLRGNRSSTCRQWRISGGNKGVGFCDRRCGLAGSIHRVSWTGSDGAFICGNSDFPWNMGAATDGR